MKMKSITGGFLSQVRVDPRSFAVKALLILAFACFGSSTFAQAPMFEKADPPSWWTQSTIDPVRVLIRGKGMNGARIESATPGITAANFKSSSNGHYLFADLRIAETVRAGSYDLRIVTTAGSVNFPFEIFAPQPRLGNYNGF